MQPRTLFSALLLASAATAQLLRQGNGNLPACGRSCTILTTAQSQCNGGSSTSVQAWSCFCQAVYQASGGALTTMCATTCTNPSDDSAIGSWFTANCGSDNGASEHGGTSNPGGTGSGNGAASSSAASSVPSATAAGGSSASGVDAQDCPDWWSCHWKWIVMVIVVAVGLLILGFGGRWLKKRHDRKRDRVSASFNAGITNRGVGPPMSTNAANESRFSGMADGAHSSPSRTREAFMPYGYAYTRSESRLASNGSPLARGTTPMGDLEKHAGGTVEERPEDSKKRRVKVRERLMGERR